MDRVINWGSSILQHALDPVINKGPSFLQNLHQDKDAIINKIMSHASCLATKINPIVERFTDHKFTVEDYTFLVDWGSSILQQAKDHAINSGPCFLQNLQHVVSPIINKCLSLIRSLATMIDRDLLLHVATVGGVAVAAIVVVWLLWTVISAVVWLLWTVISPVVWLLWAVISAVVSLLRTVISAVVWLLRTVISPVVWLPWKVISGIVRFLWNVIKGIFWCGEKTMKAPGRNFRIPRSSFASNPSKYFRNLRKSTRKSG